jgi:hypothetical protein
MGQKLYAELVPSIRIAPDGDGRGYRSILGAFAVFFEVFSKFPRLWRKAV